MHPLTVTDGQLTVWRGVLISRRTGRIWKHLRKQSFSHRTRASRKKAHTSRPREHTINRKQFTAKQIPGVKLCCHFFFAIEVARVPGIYYNCDTLSWVKVVFSFPLLRLPEKHKLLPKSDQDRRTHMLVNTLVPLSSNLLTLEESGACCESR